MEVIQNRFLLITERKVFNRLLTLLNNYLREQILCAGVSKTEAFQFHLSYKMVKTMLNVAGKSFKNFNSVTLYLLCYIGTI